MNIFSLHLDQIQSIENLLRKWEHGPLAFLGNTIHSDPTYYYLDDICETTQRDNGEIICAEQGSDILGCAILCDLPWDSKILKKRMSVIKYFIINDARQAENVPETLLDSVIEKAKNRGQEFLLCKCDTDDFETIHSLENKGFHMVDTMLNFSYDYKNPPFAEILRPACKIDISVRISDCNDCEQLMELSRRAFGKHFGRFHADPQIKHEEAIAVYEQWLKSSCRGWADWIVIAEKEKRIAGYSVWKKPSRRDLDYGVRLGHYSIGAIDPSYHRQGLFGLLTYEGMKLLLPDCDYIDGPTHINNYGVQRGYSKLGWQIIGGRHSFHKWLS